MMDGADATATSLAPEGYVGGALGLGTCDRAGCSRYDGTAGRVHAGHERL